MYEITFATEATRDLKALRKHEQQEILDGIEENLRYEPATETRNRLKMRPNELAEWELRLGSFRVFYNVFEEVLIVRVEAVGVKEGNLLFIRGRKRPL